MLRAALTEQKPKYDVTLTRRSRLTPNRDHDPRVVSRKAGWVQLRCTKCRRTRLVPASDEYEIGGFCGGLSPSKLRPFSKTDSRSHQRDEALRNKVRQMASTVSGKRPCDPHHVRSRGAGYGDRLKDGTGNLVPLTRREHAELHRVGRDTFEERYGVDLAEEARRIGEH